MKVWNVRQLQRARALFVLSACAAALAACGSQPTQQKISKQSTTEYFAESEWGVKASPRVTNVASNLPRGGGRDHLGRPYQIRGQWYHPRKDPDYRAVGMASWYGSAFHGRLTANGEVYDMTHLTAAHPTMPLPSYARVTNVDNGTSLVVRVNDRGPFVNGRIIDLSQRSAELLGTKGNGVARVEVEYLGRAPLHGQDDHFLMASYRPAGRGPQPSDGLPTGVMMAMNGASPTSAPSASVDALHRPRTSVGPTGSISRAAGSTASDPVLPRTGPIIPQRPYTVTEAGRAPAADRFGALSYADRPASAAGAALESLAVKAQAGDRPSDRLVAAWQRNAANSAEGWPSGGFHVSLGTFSDHDEAAAIAERLGGLGKVTILPANGGMASAILSPDGRADIDTILRAAWQAGAGDAMTMRD